MSRKPSVLQPVNRRLRQLGQIVQRNTSGSNSHRGREDWGLREFLALFWSWWHSGVPREVRISAKCAREVSFPNFVLFLEGKKLGNFFTGQDSKQRKRKNVLSNGKISQELLPTDYPLLYSLKKSIANSVLDSYESLVWCRLQIYKFDQPVSDRLFASSIDYLTKVWTNKTVVESWQHYCTLYLKRFLVRFSYPLFSWLNFFWEVVIHFFLWKWFLLSFQICSIIKDITADRAGNAWWIQSILPFYVYSFFDCS